MPHRHRWEDVTTPRRPWTEDELRDFLLADAVLVLDERVRMVELPAWLQNHAETDRRAPWSHQMGDTHPDDRLTVLRA